MQFHGSISKLSLVTKKEADHESTFIQLTVLVPVTNSRTIGEFAKHYRDSSEFALESSQGKLPVE